MATGISVVILTHNNEGTIADCIRSVVWCDSIIIDDYSTDRTLEKVDKHNVAIYKRSLQNDFSEQRNFALSKVTTEWALFIDADEIVNEKLAKEIQKTIKDTACNGFLVPRTTFWNGKRMRFGEFFNFSLLRLARKNSGRWEGNVHEVWKVKGKVGVLSSPIIHLQDGEIQSELRKINLYSSIRAKELFTKRELGSYFAILFMPIGKLLMNYIFKLGVLDGIPGLINAISMSFYTFLVRAKLWLLWNETTKKVSK